MKKLNYVIMSLAVWLTIVADAVAQNRDWARPVNDKINALAVGLQGIGVGLAAIGLIIVAFSYITQQRIDVTKITGVLVGATLATLAGTLVSVFFG